MLVAAFLVEEGGGVQIWRVSLTVCRINILLIALVNLIRHRMLAHIHRNRRGTLRESPRIIIIAAPFVLSHDAGHAILAVPLPLVLGLDEESADNSLIPLGDSGFLR